jgi:hypothetical protein
VSKSAVPFLHPVVSVAAVGPMQGVDVVDSVMKSSPVMGCSHAHAESVPKWNESRCDSEQGDSAFHTQCTFTMFVLSP